MSLKLYHDKIKLMAENGNQGKRLKDRIGKQELITTYLWNVKHRNLALDTEKRRKSKRWI